MGLPTQLFIYPNKIKIFNKVIIFIMCRDEKDNLCDGNVGAALHRPVSNYVGYTFSEITLLFR